MKKIVVFNKYAEGTIKGFAHPFKELILSAFGAAGYEVEHLTRFNKLEAVRNSFLISIVKPENYIKTSTLIDSSNFNIWWNLEPFVTDDGIKGQFKVHRRRRAVDIIMGNLDGYNTKCVLFFNQDQAELYKNENCYFFPIGFDPCFESKMQDPCLKTKDIVFYGHLGVARRLFFRKFDEALMMRQSKFLPTVKSPHRNFGDFEGNKIRMACTKFSIDYPDKLEEKHIHWHRIMMLAANRVVVCTTSDLSQYGFVDGEDYIHYTDHEDLANRIAIFAGQDRDASYEMAERMYEKIKTHFSMTDFISAIIDPMFEGWK